MNILEIQNRCGFKIIERLDANNLWYGFGTPQLAEYYLSKINDKSSVDIKGKAGRPKSDEAPFVTLLKGDERVKESTLKILHEIIDGKKGKLVGCAMLACFKAGMLIDLPSYKQVVGIFGKGIGNKQGYSTYTDMGYYNSTPKREMLLAEMIERFKI